MAAEDQHREICGFYFLSKVELQLLKFEHQNRECFGNSFAIYVSDRRFSLLFVASLTDRRLGAEEVCGKSSSASSVSLFMSRRGVCRRRAGESAAQHEVKRFPGCSVVQSVWSRCSSSFLLTCLLTKECWECEECTALLNREGDTWRAEAWPLSPACESASHCVSSSQAFAGKWCLKRVIRVIVAVGCLSLVQNFWRPLSLLTYLPHNRSSLLCWRLALLAL